MQPGQSCHDLGVKGRKKEAKNKVDYDKVICSMSEWVAGPGKEQREHTNLHSKEESVSRSSQWPWGSLVLCQNFWLDVMQRLSRATSAEKMLEWWSKMCWRKYWQHAHGRILYPERRRNHFSRSWYLSFYITVIMDTVGHSQFSLLHSISPKSRRVDSQRVL